MKIIIKNFIMEYKKYAKFIIILITTVSIGATVLGCDSGGGGGDTGVTQPTQPTPTPEPEPAAPPTTVSKWVIDGATVTTIPNVNSYTTRPKNTTTGTTTKRYIKDWTISADGTTATANFAEEEVSYRVSYYAENGTQLLGTKEDIQKGSAVPDYTPHPTKADGKDTSNPSDNKIYQWNFAGWTGATVVNGPTTMKAVFTKGKEVLQSFGTTKTASDFGTTGNNRIQWENLIPTGANKITWTSAGIDASGVLAFTTVGFSTLATSINSGRNYTVLNTLKTFSDTSKNATFLQLANAETAIGQLKNEFNDATFNGLADTLIEAAYMHNRLTLGAGTYKPSMQTKQTITGRYSDSTPLTEEAFYATEAADLYNKLVQYVGNGTAYQEFDDIKTATDANAAERLNKVLGYIRYALIYQNKGDKFIFQFIEEYGRTKGLRHDVKTKIDANKWTQVQPKLRKMNQIDMMMHDDRNSVLAQENNGRILG